MAGHLHPIFCTWDAVNLCTPVTVFFPLGVRLGLEKVKIPERKGKKSSFGWETKQCCIIGKRSGKKKCALAGSRTRIYCLEGSNADRYTTNASTRKRCTTLGFVSWRVWWPRQNNTRIHLAMVAYRGRDMMMLPRSCDHAPQTM